MNKLKDCLLVAVITTFVFYIGPQLAAASGHQKAQDIHKMEQKIETLEKRIQDLEKGQMHNTEDLEILNDDMVEIEKKTLMDKINLGAEIRVRGDWFSLEDKLNDVDDKVSITPSTRFRLNLGADVSDNLRFSGRLSILENWGDNDIGRFNSLSNSRVRGDNSLKVERAYADYFFDFMPVALTIGRLPMADGLPTDFREDTPRKSTYPALAYDTEADGVALSFDLSKLIPLPNPALRFIYTKQVQDDDSEIYRNDTLEAADLSVYAAQIETGLPGMFADTLFIFNYVNVPKLSAPSSASLSALLGAPVTTVSLPDDLGDLTKYTFFLQSKRFLGSWIDWFAGYSITKIKPSGTAANYLINGVIPYSLGYLSDDNLPDRKGHCYHVGARVNLPIEALNYPKFGVEYNKGSKYWLGTTFAAEDPLDKLAVKGNAWDFYYIQPVDKYFTIRAGYTVLNVDWTAPGLFYGDVQDADQDITNTYVLLDIKF